MNLLGRLGITVLAIPALLSAGTAQGTGTGGPIPSGAFVTSGTVTSDIVLSNSGYVAPGNAITVTLLGLQHDFAGDLQITLSYINTSGTTVQSVDLLNRIGATSSNTYGTPADFGNNQGLGDNYVFNTDYAGNIWNAANCADPPGCTEPLGDADSIPGVSTDKVNNGQYFTSTTGGTKTNLSYAFSGLSVSGGKWRLTITDAADPNVGSFIGWQISIATVASVPTSISAAGGTPQFTTVSTSFAAALQALVTDTNNNPVAGVPVTFTAPASGASATLSGASSVTVVSNSSGIAISPIPVANATAGSYSVAASSPGLSSASFSLTNSPINSGSPGVTLSASALAFGSQLVGTISASQTLTVTNSGTGTLNISSIQITGSNASDFTATNGCTTAVAPAASCTISLVFDPAAAGARSATLAISDNAAGSPQSVSLTGTGIAPPTNFSTYLAPYGSNPPTLTGATAVVPIRAYNPGGSSQINFVIAFLQNASTGADEYEIVAQTDGAGGFTLRATDFVHGIVPSPFLEMSPSGVTVTLPTPIAIGALQITAYRFALDGNEMQLDLTMTRNDTFNDQIVLQAYNNVNYSTSPNPIAGFWTASSSAAPNISLSPNTLTFSTQTVGTSTSQSITVGNTGTASLSITSVQVSGTNSADFTETNTCPSSLAPNSSCSINVTFTPSVTGAESATLSISDNAAGSPQSVPLSGTGSAAATPTTFTTYLAPYGSTPPTFTGATAVVPTRAYNPGGAAQINFMIAFIQNATTGTDEYEIVAQTDGAGGYTLRATDFVHGVVPSPALEMSLSGATVTLPTPISTGSLQITAYRFALVGNEMQLDLTLTQSGTFNNQIVLQAYNNVTYSTSPNPVDGYWTASSSPAPNVSLSPTSLTFSSQSVGTSTSQAITVSNTGTASLSVTSVQISGTNATDFTETNTCSSSVAPNSSCSINVTFTPSASGTRSATLSISDNAAGSPQSVPLSGSGSSTATPTTFTTYLAPYGSNPPTFSGATAVVPLRAYNPGGASQINFVIAFLQNATTGADEYEIVAQTDGAGGYTLRATDFVHGVVPSPPLEMSLSGVTVTLPTPISTGSLQISAYRFALVGNEMQLDLTLTRSDTFNDQIVMQAYNNVTYSSSPNPIDGYWHN